MSTDETARKTTTWDWPMTDAAYLEERIYLPDGMDPDDYEVSTFAVRVQWRRKGEWAVVQGLGFPAHRFLTSKGNWLFLPMPMHRRYCRFDFDTACHLAAQHVNAVTANGRTWAEWEAHRAAQTAIH